MLNTDKQNKKNHNLPKDLLSLSVLNKDEITYILDTAESFKEVSEREIKKVPTLRGKLVVLFFHEDSTRTRLSFEVAAKRLSADTVNLGSSGSSIKKGESLIDTAKNIEAMIPDALIIRHSASGAAEFLAQRLKCTVLNAGDGSHAHPSQALLDLLTIREVKGDFKNLKVTILGDIAHSRVARSNMVGLKTMGAKVTICGPPTMIPLKVTEEYGVNYQPNPEIALKGADVVMLLRIQLERQNEILFPSAREYAKVYGLNEKRFALASPEAILLHPGPVNQGIELSPDLYEHPRSMILAQVTNGVAVRMALLYLLVSGKEWQES